MSNAMTIIDGISGLIADAGRRLQSERHHPDGSNPDMSDQKIKQLTLRLKTLRRIREELEDEMAVPV